MTVNRYSVHIFAKFICAAVALSALLSVSSVGFADEKIGTFSVDDMRLRGTYLSTEDQGGTFNIDDSEFAVRWRKDGHLSAYFAIGDQAARNLPVYYSDSNTSQLGFVDAYGEYNGVYGRVRAGLLPVDFGYDSTVDSTRRYFHYSQSIRDRIIGLHDKGASFYTEHFGYYTELIVHNGSIDLPNDGDPWVTANWGYTNFRNFKAQLSLQTGTVKGDLTQNLANTLAGVQSGVTTHWRNGALFVRYNPVDWNFAAEVGGGEAVQNSSTGRYQYDLVEAQHDFTKNLTAGIRYDYLDPNMKVYGDAETEVSAMVALRSDDQSSNLIFEGVKRLEESHEVHNDEFRVVWLLTPYAK